MVAGESTGSTEAFGHYTLIHIDSDERHSIGEDLGVEDHGPVVVIPAGWYMVGTDDQGRVWVDHCETEQAAMEIFTALDQSYGDWLAANDLYHKPE